MIDPVLEQEYLPAEEASTSLQEYEPLQMTAQANKQRSAVWAALAAPTDDPIGVFTQIKGELSSFGTSPTMETIEDTISTAEKQSLIGSAVDLAETDQDAALSMIDNMDVILEETTNLKNVAMDNMSAADGSQASVQAQEYQTGYQLLLEERSAREGAIAAIEGIISEGSLNTLDNIADIGDLALIEQAPLSGAAKVALFNISGADE